mgnify:FL=1
MFDHSSRSSSPLGPFTKLADLVHPWAHNPQTIVSPDATSKHGYTYVVYALGDGVPRSGPPKNCTKNATSAATLSASALAAQKGLRLVTPPTAHTRRRLGSSEEEGDTHHEVTTKTKTITANFTLHWAEEAAGPYHAVNASILNWPTNWDYGANGNWNPSPFQHPNGSVYLMAHTSWRAFCGETIIRADHWRGPYTIVSSDQYANWHGSACGVEDPFLWMDKRGHWHALYHAMGHLGPGGHAFSVDGYTWSNVTNAYGAKRPLVGGGSVNYNAERPKLLFGPNYYPTHLYTGSDKGSGFTIASPLTS